MQSYDDKKADFKNVAKYAEAVSKPDFFDWEIKINSNVTFFDGKPVNYRLTISPDRAVIQISKSGLVSSVEYVFGILSQGIRFALMRQADASFYKVIWFDDLDRGCLLDTDGLDAVVETYVRDTRQKMLDLAMKMVQEGKE